jgi:UDP-2-acetamido-3-amino-2,3-dideoxy-glucuronate N-acetyltransferase
MSTTAPQRQGDHEGGGSLPKVAVIGTGYWGRNLVRTFCQLGALAAVDDADEITAAKVAEQYGVPVRPLAAVLEDDGIPAVAIAAPARLHFTLARDALEAGKHVFVEKPLALEVGHAEALCRLADERGRTLMVGHLLHYHPAFVGLQDLVRQGRLGRLQYLYSNRLNLGRVRRDENILWSFAPHDISMILALVGVDPESVLATGASYLHQRIADVTTTHLAFPGGEHAHIFVSWLHPFKEQKLVVVGDRCMAVFDDGRPWNEKLAVYPHRIDWHDGKPEPMRAEAEPVALTAEEPLLRECRHFLECVASRKRPLTDGPQGLRVLRVIDAAERSMSAGGSVRPSAGLPAAKPVRPGVMIHETAVVDEPCEIGEGTRIWHFTHVLKGSRIGRRCSIGQNVMIGPDVAIGDNCKIQNNVSIFNGVTLEDGVFCGPSMVFTNVLNPRAEVERKDEFRPTLVRRGATIGANATIVCGATLGAYSFVAAGAVVTKDVAAHALVAGVPARRLGWMSHAGERLADDLVCPRTGQRYKLVDSETLRSIEE